MGLGAFGNKVFEVNLKKIYTFAGLVVSDSLNVEMQETEGGKPATYIKGKNQMDISIDITLLSQFCDVQAEIDWWFFKMRSETPEYLTLGSKTFGTNKMLLHSVSMADTIISPTGDYVKAKLSLGFSEWTKKGYKKPDSSGSTTTNNDKPTTYVKPTTEVKTDYGVKKVGTLDKQMVLGSDQYVQKYTVNIGTIQCFQSGVYYYPLSYITKVKTDGGRTTVNAFPKGTPIYSDAQVSGGGSGGGSR